MERINYVRGSKRKRSEHHYSNDAPTKKQKYSNGAADIKTFYKGRTGLQNHRDNSSRIQEYWNRKTEIPKRCNEEQKHWNKSSYSNVAADIQTFYRGRTELRNHRDNSSRKQEYWNRKTEIPKPYNEEQKHWNKSPYSNVAADIQTFSRGRTGLRNHRDRSFRIQEYWNREAEIPKSYNEEQKHWNKSSYSNVAADNHRDNSSRKQEYWNRKTEIPKPYNEEQKHWNKSPYSNVAADIQTFSRGRTGLRNHRDRSFRIQEYWNREAEIPKSYNEEQKHWNKSSYSNVAADVQTFSKGRTGLRKHRDRSFRIQEYWNKEAEIPKPYNEEQKHWNKSPYSNVAADIQTFSRGRTGLRNHRDRSFRIQEYWNREAEIPKPYNEEQKHWNKSSYSNVAADVQTFSKGRTGLRKHRDRSFRIQEYWNKEAEIPKPCNEEQKHRDKSSYSNEAADIQTFTKRRTGLQNHRDKSFRIQEYWNREAEIPKPSNEVQKHRNKSSEIQKFCNEISREQKNREKLSDIQKCRDKSSEIQKKFNKSSEIQKKFNKSSEIQKSCNEVYILLDKSSELQKQRDKSSELQKQKDKSSEVMNHRDKSSEVMNHRDKSSELQRDQDKLSEVQKPCNGASEIQKGQDKSSEIQKHRDKSSEIQKHRHKLSEIQKPCKGASEVQKHKNKSSEIQKSCNGSSEVQKHLDKSSEIQKPSIEASEIPKPSIEASEIQKPSIEASEIQENGNETPGYEVSSDDEVLTLYLSFPPILTCHPSLEGLEEISLDGHNYLPVEVNGKCCKMFVDSGTTSNGIEHRLAQKLGLDKKVDSTILRDSWFSSENKHLKISDKVVVNTGSDASTISQLFLKHIGMETCPPKKLRIHVKGDLYLEDDLEVLENPKTEIPLTLGTTFLSKYNCTLDSSSYYLFYNINNKTYVFTLLKTQA
ncbi:micronuclear linker histone polyprotein-like [Procambarus clarkii]|uniref:micronuclear linker histone polyprotein-like n=1 Tax=Procambarus clarkii TaxID=6728 RepID=UPI003742BFB8